jgi:TonB family protein
MATQSTDTAKPRVRTQADELMVIAQRAQAFTNASGTAIALSEGNTEEFTCRARSGAAAPEVGTTMRLEGSFTGLCVQTGKELRCDDAETDTRVDTNAIRALGIRSMVVTPIKEDNKVIGVLACFAPTAHAFTITHVAVLKTMADQISGLLQRERRMREEGAVSEPPAAAAFPKAAPPAPAPVVIKPSVSNGNGTAAAPAKSAFPVVSRVETAKPAEASPAISPKKEEKRPEARANFGTLDAMTAKPASSGANFKMIAAVAVVVVAALGTFAFLKMRKPSAPAPTASQVAANTPAAQAQESSNSQIQVSATPAAVNSQTSSAASSSTNVSEPAKTEHVSSSDNSRKSEKSSSKNSEKAVAVEPEAKPTPATVALNRGPSRIGSAAPVSAGEVSPTLAVDSGSATGTISALTVPVNTSAPAALRQSNLEPMQVLKTVPPIYPAIAKMRRLSGQVMVEFTVGKDGKAHNPKLLSGQAAFRDAAFEAVRQWTFKPAKLDGKPIEQTTQVRMDFHP